MGPTRQRARAAARPKRAGAPALQHAPAADASQAAGASYVSVPVGSSKAPVPLGRGGDSYLTAEISASAIRANLRTLRSLAPGAKLCPVVKADGYGLGIATLLGTIAPQADALAVATPAEALELRRLGYDRPVLAFFSPGLRANDAAGLGALVEAVARGVTLTVVTKAEVSLVAGAAAEAGAAADVHMKVDTGMTRSGTAPRDVPALIEHVDTMDNVHLTGMYTHFAAADEGDLAFTREQLARLTDAAAAVGSRKPLTLHAANSAATMQLPEAHLDMVRPGIAMYGYPPSPSLAGACPLRPALRLWGPLMQVRQVSPGDACGYGLTYRFDRPGRVGLVPIGYADGYLRCLSNRAVMRVAGREAPVRGRVSMDQTIIDLTDVPDAAVGDAVEIISPDPAAANSVENLAALAGTIPYELISRLGRRAKRVLVE